MPPPLSTEPIATLVPALLACLVLFLTHAGFALFETGLCRAKNASHTMTMNVMAPALGTIGFFVCGFAFMCGGTDRWLIHLGDWGVLGGRGFFLSGQSAKPIVLLWFFLMMARLNISVAIPAGALAERWRFKGFIGFSLLMTAVICPVYGCWVWGSGWISQLGEKLHWGHGGVDYAGSSVIHMQGGVIALVAAWLIGPRIGKYDARGRPRPIPGHHVPMGISGSLILAVAFLTLNAVVSLATSDGRIFVVAVNSALAAAGGALAASLHLSFVYGKSDPTLICNGMLGGLVAIAAPCAFVEPWAALLIGAIAGILAVWFIFFLERCNIDDPVGVISVHGVNGLWGTLALGLFADGTFGQGYNGVTTTMQGVSGLFYGDGKQLLCQFVMAGVCLIWSLVAGGVAFLLVGKFFGPNRVPREVELMGLDIPEVGVPAYPEFFNPMPSSTGFAAEPRPATSPSVAGQRRFSVVVEGIDATSLINTWSSLCQTGTEPPPAEFKEIYPFVTTVTGNRFRFSGGDPTKIRDSLARLFQSILADKPISTRIES